MKNRICIIWLLLWVCAGFLGVAPEARTQGSEGRTEGTPKPTPTATPPKPPGKPPATPRRTTTPPRATPPPVRTAPTTPVRTQPAPVRPTPTPRIIVVPVLVPVEPDTLAPPRPEPPPCRESHLVVRCGLPGCEVTVDKVREGTTNADGELSLNVTRGAHTVSVSKSGYERMQRTIDVGCGQGEAANLFLKTKPYEIRVHTNLPACEVFLNNSPYAAGQTDAQGFLTLRVSEVQILVEARKNGYVAASANVTPDTAHREINLYLGSVPSRLFLTANAPKAEAQVDGAGEWLDVSEPISLAPGPHTVTVRALGFAPVTLELTPGASERLDRRVDLARLPVPDLLAQAEQALKERNWLNLHALCRFVWEADPANAAAHRLSGLAYLENQDYAQAEPHLRQALNGGQSFTVRIRRHPQEKFELSKGHDACLGWLTFAPGSLEYRGDTVGTENFRVAKAALQVLGLQIKKDTALCLSLKVADDKGKRRDYNFFSHEKELTGEGKAYLEMLQRLLAAL